MYENTLNTKSARYKVCKLLPNYCFVLSIAVVNINLKIYIMCLIELGSKGIL